MRDGPPHGETATLAVTVTPEMTARLDDVEVHPVYGTTALVQHVEQVCRRLLVPHLEPGEEGVGVVIEVAQRLPVPVGETVTLTATVASVGPTRLVCEVMARHGGATVARGSFEQRVVDLQAFRDQVASRRTAAGTE